MKLHEAVRGVEVKEFDRDDDGVEICHLERHFVDKGYNALAQAEVVVDRAAMFKCIGMAWVEDNDVAHAIVESIATAIESGAIIRLKEEEENETN